MQRTHRSFVRPRLVGAALLVVLVVAMVLNTRFLTPQEVAAIAPKAFDPAQIATDLYAKAQSGLTAGAAPLGQVVPAFQSDVKAAANTFKATSPNEGAYVFPVTATATVTEATATALKLQVDGVPAQTQILVPLTTAVNGAAVRDGMGFTFGQAPDQTRYQYVADELRKLMLAALATAVPDPAAVQGKKVTVLGVVAVLATGAAVPAAKPVNIQPISIKVTS